MSCVSALHSQLVTLLSVPHEILFLRHRVFKEYVKIAVGPDFIHTLPSFIVLTAMILVLWRSPPKIECATVVASRAAVFRAIQVLASWIVVNAVIWLWLIFQRILYCFVWSYWSYESEYRETSMPWWQRVWSSYYPPPLQPPIFSAGFISWILSMMVAIGILGCATSPNLVRNVLSDLVIAARDYLHVVRNYMTWSTSRFREAISSERCMAIDESEISSVCDDCRSEESADANQGRIARREVHPISYGTNWTPRPNFSGYKAETGRKYQEKGIRIASTVAGSLTRRNEEKLSPRQTRHRRGCHTVIPSNSSDKSSAC
ncbi:uncharacterized protein LOC105693867 [Athalia rosae]|uniref:uncharacterized protein LOC105693867 n=1 Tax=Athalia rosae TaxID=37344 RepID=UPI002033B738|nr:uncharacterized protein LOC105693867 [Athalia rosae]